MSWNRVAKEHIRPLSGVVVGVVTGFGIWGVTIGFYGISTKQKKMLATLVEGSLFTSYSTEV